MKYFAIFLITMIAELLLVCTGSGYIPCIILIIAMILAAAAFLASDRRKNRELDDITGLLLKLQDGQTPPEIRALEGRTGILRSEIYKLVTIMSEKAGNASREKKYLADMLSDISHQIKTPVAAITIMTDLLEQDDLPADKRHEFTENIEKQTAKITWMIKNLLVLSQLEASVLKLKKESISLGELIERACHPVRLIADVKNTEIRTEQMKEKIYIECDVQWTAEALTNIIKNCVEHTQERGIIKISADQNNLGTNIFVSDNGPGIADEDLPHIFERFYKGKNSSRDSVGIGLAISRQIIVSQNGMLKAENLSDGGALFSVRFYS